MSMNIEDPVTEDIARDFNLANLPADYIANPYRYFETLRRIDPVHRMPDGSYFLTRYDDLVSVYRNPKIWSSDKKVEFKPAMGDSPLYEHHTTSLVFRDPPDHTRLRKLFQAAFTPKAIANLEPRIEKLVDGYLDAAEDKGSLDLVEDFAFMLPVEVVCDMLGAPSSERNSIRDWAQAILGGLEPVMTDETREQGSQAVNNFKDFLRDLIKHRRENPTSGESGEVLSALIEAEEDGEKLTELELLHQCIFLLNAGHETTTNMLANGIHELLTNDEQRGKLHKNPQLVESCIEEVLRFDSPIQLNNRRALEDTELGGVSIPQGSQVHLSIGGGNHDPEQFDRPGQFDIERAGNKHLAFGAGVHICAGNSLARTEGRIAYSKLFFRFPELHLSGPVVRSPRVRFKGFSNLPAMIR
jgi:cytochrome P450